MSNKTMIPTIIDNFYKAASVTLVADRFVLMSADDKITPSVGATDLVIGVCLNTTAKVTVKVAVGLLGIFPVEVYGTATRGTFAKLANTGSYYGCVENATPANAEKIVGIFLESGVSGDKVRVLVLPIAMPAS